MEEKLVREVEERLRRAMIDGDVACLSELIDDHLTFVNHFGQLLTKDADIEAHRSGVVNFTDITFLCQRIIPLEGAAVTITQAKLQVTVGGEQIEDEMFYTRVWKMDNGELKVISGHCSSVQK
ncbi:DUF4440 domain-containing protein [Paenibacillus sp. CAA11]|uniref:nuclear transport factor 2 family protein n=1 Tax=Paenibacillus sp. CAA11 TaxID=1532905 RepID=UPI000D3A20D2|nr:nuclear transport factor 2 family protein [Paenibacillus sp. CAA11]AWB46548.1 DUF4440 domain-containing protein [Paenibacillus sp. CAA11]